MQMHILRRRERPGGAAVPSIAQRAVLPLAACIARQSRRILRAWDAKAASLAHPDYPLDRRQLRDNAGGILADIVFVLSAPGTATSPGAGAQALASDDGLSACERHADARRAAGFSLQDVVAEYAALRSNVLRICSGGADLDFADVLAFNEALDAALARCTRRYELQAKAATDLFLGILAHDIRNPLGTIVSRTELALLTGQTTPARGMPVINAARRIRGIIDQTVDFTRLQSFGALPVVREFGDLGVLLAKVVEETQLRHGDRTTAFLVDGDLWGLWDYGRLAQVLSNLLGNAITYGSRDSEITVRMWGTMPDVFLSVHNFGVPIPTNEAMHIFSPLFRGTNAERRARSGLGLGLYICREIVRAHHGDIRVASSQDDGTVFTVRLPREDEPQAPPGARPTSPPG